AVVVASGLDTKVLEAVKAIGEAQGLQLLGAVEKPLTARRLAELLGSYRRQPAAPAGGAKVAVSGAEAVAALDSGAIGSLFQPVVDLATCEVTAAEAVGGWLHPTKGPIPPAVFLPVLAAEGLVPRYVDVLLAQACTALALCRDAGVRLRIGVDVGPAALGDVTLADRFLATVRAAGAEPSQLVFEVAEHGLAEAPPAALDVMTRLRVKGFGLALDQFGARASARRLAHIPFTELKMDAGLVRGEAGRHDGLEVLQEMYDAGRALGIPMAADGCETEADLDVVVDLGFRYAQGSFVGGPVGPAELVDGAGAWSPPPSRGGRPR
ncbi:MAG TPA: EAL domain-containing response regulator, partial [Acidimicrobiales bacterium]|nr:EAL domain-containing response regulator [Acidimicrobiales bacterium]